MIALFITLLLLCVGRGNTAMADGGFGATSLGIPPPTLTTAASLDFGASTSNGTSDGAGGPTNNVFGASEQVAETAIHNAAASQLDTLPTAKIDAFWRNLQGQYGTYLPDVSGVGIVRAIFNSGGPNLHGVMVGLLRYFFAEVLDNAQLLGGILVLSVIAAVLESMQSAFEQQTVSQVAYAVIFLVLMVLAISSFTEAIGSAKHAIQSMNDFMLSSVPLVVALLAASGALASAAFFQPLLLFAVHFISNLVFVLVFPLIFFSAVLDITSALSVRYQLTKLAGLLRTCAMTVLAFCLSLFLGVTTVQGIGKGVVDGVMLRTAKTAVSTLPIVGKAVSDAAETILSASLLVKNAIGIAGLVIIACIAIFPALKILALSFIYGGSSALMQPLGDSPMIACLGTLSKSLVLVFACVAAVALMFFVAICILIATANLAVITG